MNRSCRRALQIVVTVVAVVGCASESRETIAHLIEIETCINPVTHIDGARWETTDTVPDEWRDELEIAGEFQIIGDESGVFSAPAGVELNYFLSDGFSDLECRIS